MLVLDLKKSVTLVDILLVANDLVDDPGSNPEYEGALIQLITDLFSFGDSDNVQSVVRGLLYWPEA